MDAIRRRVLNVVGHELRTPVTMLHGLADVVSHATDLQTVTNELGPALLRTCERLARLLDDLLIASGIKTALPVEAFEPVEIPELIRQLWSSVGVGRIQVGPPGAVAIAHPTGLSRAVEAVLANAAQYGTDVPSVSLATDGHTTTISVRSPGPALHPEEIALAAEAFFRGERAVTTRPGLGVGLAIATAQMQAMNGRLEFADDPEGGTITTLVIPAQDEPG